MRFSRISDEPLYATNDIIGGRVGRRRRGTERVNAGRERRRHQQRRGDARPADRLGERVGVARNEARDDAISRSLWTAPSKPVSATPIG